MPAIQKSIADSNVLQHYPVSAEVVRLDATVLSAESYAKKSSSREQLLNRFRGAALFAHSKNTKLEYMAEDLSTAFHKWQDSWSRVTDQQFCSKESTFVDLEVFLWRKCCLDAYYKSRVVLLADKKPARGNPHRTVYPFATTRDSTNQTLFASPSGKERADGLVYSQFYGLIKTPFDTSKAYIFQQDALENLALDPGYIHSLQQEGGGITFSKAVCEKAYLHMKQRAHVNLRDNLQRSYGIREEHRISLTMMEEIESQWTQQDLYSISEDSPSAPLPYYIVPTQELLGFLRAQINKYCFLFEHTRANTFGAVSLAEQAVMIVALRALRFCYGSNILSAESLLYIDRWENSKQKLVVVEGFGMQQTIEQCGLGWFLPKFNWATLRIKPPHGENLLNGCLLMHTEYKKRWQAVKDLQNIYVRFNQAERWFQEHNIGKNPGLLRKWLEYLYALNLEQFDADVWKAMLKAHKQTQQLSPQALEQRGKMAYCFDGMKGFFLNNGVVSPPHIVTGNKGAFKGVEDLLNFLFLEDERKRLGWGWKPFRQILQRTLDLLEKELGYQRSQLWLDQFLHLVRLTHWILPYPSDRALIESTKTSQEKGLSRKLMWFSAIFNHPTLAVQQPEEDNPRTLHVLLYKAHRSTGRYGSMNTPWDAFQLIKAYGKHGIKMLGEDESKEYWSSGRRSIGSQGWAPVWEQGKPPLLKMQERIRGMSLDELEAMMVEFVQEQSNQEKVIIGPGAVYSITGTRAAHDATSQSHSGNSRVNSNQEREDGSAYLPSEQST
ncbi:hypothetical protein BU25DRAFT_451613 [Macroventuria anomochaeta]|uniref:Uncharacterized protein n=1 Tax=Macroventuria anomochaeta TaxID=301207 RepID=A0ACB6RMH7_9PLEO|nr:uncharacterized protein BU25DRAFT_451613 [Macroventuria anomochaeta]KAF2622933.1 hypothetical protein BU25DRAFT_451613 [Macroventuria anomochaeta]